MVLILYFFDYVFSCLELQVGTDFCLYTYYSSPDLIDRY